MNAKYKSKVVKVEKTHLEVLAPMGHPNQGEKVTMDKTFVETDAGWIIQMPGDFDIKVGEDIRLVMDARIVIAPLAN